MSKKNSMTPIVPEIPAATPTAPVIPSAHPGGASGTALIAEGTGNPLPRRGASAKVRIEALDDGIHGEVSVTIELYEHGRTFNLLPFDNEEANTADLALRACDVEVVYQALGRALAVAKQAGIVPAVPGYPSDIDNSPEAMLANIPPEYLAPHPGFGEWLTSTKPEAPSRPLASWATE